MNIALRVCNHASCIKHGYRNVCKVAYNTARYHKRRAAGMDSYQARGRSPEVTRHRNLGRYYKLRVSLGFTAWEASGKIVPGNEPETQRRLAAQRESNRKYMKKYRELWGYPASNFYDRFHHGIARDLGFHSKAEVQQYLRDRPAEKGG